MKVKYLVILFIFFLGIMFLSFFVAQQSQQAVSLSEKEVLTTRQVNNIVLPVYSPQAMSASIVPLAPGKSGITIIKSPVIEPEDKISSVLKTADKAINNVDSQNIASSIQSEESVAAAGITRIGKQPTHKEAQEMNSSGIVMY